MEQEPRHFWRRGFAFILDCLYMGILAFLICYPLTVILPNYFVILDAPIKGYSCLPSQGPSDAFRENIPADFFEPDADLSYQTCTFYAFFLEAGTTGTAYVRTKTVDENGISNTFTKYFSATIDKDGNPTPATDVYSYLFWAFLVFLIAYILLRNNGRTFAKEHLGLKLLNDQKPSYWQFVKRELLKYLPTIFLIANGLLLWIAALVMGQTTAVNYLADNLWITIILGVSTSVLSIFWYIIPLIRWKGLMPYDRLTGFKVVRE